MIAATVDKRWVLNRSDELAVENGCRFDEERARWAVQWIESYCCLYEGEWAGQSMRLTDWQLDATMRMFGWVRWSEKWQRCVRRFRRVSLWVAKKNKKTPTAAAWALYLLCGDGEQGQKVFLAAKDGQQVRQNLARHTVEMVRASPALARECKINRTTSEIAHLPSKSVMLILSNSNARTQESKEGLNGSAVIDEVHVVDREFMSRIDRMGISRSEPLQIEVSTAGNNPDGYGFEQFARAMEVIEGKREDQELLAIVYTAPQNLTAAELSANPLKYGRMANPAMGHTVDPEEYLSDYNRCKDSLTKLLAFMMYRLNIWQRSSNPWLDSAAWQRCARQYTADDMEGWTCDAGLDLSRTQDMSALVLVFSCDEEETFRLLPFFWLPEDVARENDHLAPFMTWAKQGMLELTPGSVIDYGFIRTRFRELAERFNIRKLAYDQTYAEETTQALEQGVMNAAGEQIEAGTGVERFVFPQTQMFFAKPCKDFERLILAGTLHHNDHPILNWQAGHVQVRPDANQNVRPVKPKRGDVKKIDGIVAAIMGLTLSMDQTSECGFTDIKWG